MKTLRKSKGFSLIELLVVIAIIGVLSAVGITAYTGYTASAKEQASRTQFAQVVSMVNHWEMMNIQFTYLDLNIEELLLMV